MKYCYKCMKQFMNFNVREKNTDNFMVRLHGWTNL